MRLIHWIPLLMTGFFLVGQAQAVFIVEDFNTATLYECVDSAGKHGSCDPATTPIDNGTTAWGDATTPHTGITRTFDATLLNPGDRIATIVSPSILSAELTSDAGAINSRGAFSFLWTGPAVALSAYDRMEFDWWADLASVTWHADFGVGTEAVDTSLQGPLASNPFPASPVLGSAALPTYLGSGPGLTGIVQISFHFSGVEGLDAVVDNVRITAIPEPTALALVDVGLADLGYRRNKFRPCETPCNPAQPLGHPGKERKP